MDEKDTKEKIMDTAERLFAQDGIKETSVREITAKAETHLASVNYHFGSKDGLIRAVLARRTEPLNRERLRLLETFEIEAKNKPVDLELILYALFSPSIKFCLNFPDFMQLAGRMLSEPDKEIRRVFVSQFEDVFLRFKAALRKSFSTMPEKELLWRMHFLAGAMIHTVTNHLAIESLSGGLCTLSEEKEVLERLIGFCSAGLRAPIRTERRRKS